jgi:Tol biopolymer transport system component
VKRALERVEVPDADGAAERGWRVVAAAYSGRAEARLRPRLRSPALVVAAIALIALVVVALTPPGGAVGDWVRERFVGTGDPPARLPAKPALAAVPGGGRLLVESASGPWVVHGDGSRRLLGSYSDATWSPRGLFVAAARGNELFAVTPAGRVRWVVERPQAVHTPRWAPSGYRVAYRAGTSVRVVAGDGTGDRLLAPAAGKATPAWRPGSAANVLAYVDRRDKVTVVDVDTRQVLWRRDTGGPPRLLAWSADGRRLLALRARFWRVLDGRGREVGFRPAPRRAAATAAAFAPRGHRFAVVLQRRASTDVLLARDDGRERLVFRGLGSFGGLAWSPDGRWIAVGWPSADQWLFLRPAPSRSPIPIDGVARRFDPRGGAAPRIVGWVP